MRYATLFSCITHARKTKKTSKTKSRLGYPRTLVSSISRELSNKKELWQHYAYNLHVSIISVLSQKIVRNPWKKHSKFPSHMHDISLLFSLFPLLLVHRTDFSIYLLFHFNSALYFLSQLNSSALWTQVLFQRAPSSYF